MTHPSPVTESERIQSLDVLRGVAVLGILVMNITAFALVSAAYMNPTVYGDLAGSDRWVWLVCHVLADMKMMSIFSMLFGAGIVLMADRVTAVGGNPAAVHYRRMGWLLLFGLLHAHLLWYGDILYTYAMCGFAAYLLRKAPAWLLVLLAVIALTVSSGLSLVSGLTMDQWPEANVAEFMKGWAPTAEQIAEEETIYRGGWLEQMQHRVPASLGFQTFVFLFFIGPRAGGMILLGMALYKWGVFSARRSNGFYAALVAIAALVGVPLILYGVQYNEVRDWPVSSFFLGLQFNYWGSIFVALGWVGVVCLWMRLGVGRFVASVLAATGRMAFTNYLTQTIICTTLFYGHGFGLYGKLDRTEIFIVVLAVWAVQLTWSPLWLRHFRYGPFEWVWRSLTYWELQPMRRRLET